MNFHLFLTLASSIVLFQCEVPEKPAGTTPVEAAQTTNQAAPKVPSWIVYPWLPKNADFVSCAGQILPPKGAKRIMVKEESFAEWLRFLPLKKNQEKVKLYNGELKGNQKAHAAILDIDVGEADLQQCADAVMRLRAEYQFNRSEVKNLYFNYTSGDKIPFERWSNGERPVVNGNKVTWKSSPNANASYESFKRYLLSIYMYAGTASLSKEMTSVKLENMRPGDVLIQGGFPGHAVIVQDMCEGMNGEKYFTLAQSYMPAQDIHILKNPNSSDLSPWYSLSAIQDQIHTPEWTFNKENLKHFSH